MTSILSCGFVTLPHVFCLKCHEFLPSQNKPEIFFPCSISQTLASSAGPRAAEVAWRGVNEAHSWSAMASTEADMRRVVRIKVGLLPGDLDLAGMEGVGVGGDMAEII